MAEAARDIDVLRGAAANPAVADFVALLKPRVMSLVVLTGATGLVLAPGALHPVQGLIAVLCIAIAAGAAGAINMWYERDIDALMRRTATRPLPAGRIESATALGFAIVLAVASVAVMGLATNALAAGLLAATIAFYVFVYTIWLKRRTPQNIVIGGAAGALPPVVGWAAATGTVDALPLALFAIIFLWTPPHFWALALNSKAEYARARLPMLPNVAGDAATRRQILIYALALIPASLLPVALGAAGWTYGAGTLALGLVFVAGAARLCVSAAEADARRLFGFSILYLALLFVLLLVDDAAAGAI